MTAYLRTVPQLTLAAARLAIDAAVTKAESIAAPQNIAVVDAGGNLIAFARMEGARKLARHSAIAKAETAASLMMPTGQLPPQFGVDLSLATGNRSINLKGGLPILHNGAVIGAVGVSSGADDEDLAVAGAAIEAVLAALAE